MLLVDADPQGQVALGLGFPKKVRVTLKNMLENIIMGLEFDPKEVILKHKEGVEVIPANKLLAGLDVALINVEDREKVLKEYLELLEDDYDYILIDCIGDMEVSLLIPFTESVDVINDIRGMVHNNVSLIAKIETESGMNNIEEIARKAEGILIGRGDLALYSNLKDLFPNLRDAIEKVRENKIIFCTGILQNFSDAYMPERAEIFDLMLIKQLYANELILSGSSDFNFSNIRELYLHSLKSIKRKVGFINNVW